MIVEFPEHDLMLEEQCDGICVRQHGKEYVALKWQLNGPLFDVVRVALTNGFCCLWQERHPGGRSSHHISFSRSHAPASWVFCLGDGNGAPDVRSITVSSSRYEDLVRRREIGGRRSRGGGKNYVIQPEKLCTFIALVPAAR
jgi:hypothetical protein